MGVLSFLQKTSKGSGASDKTKPMIGKVTQVT